MVEEKKEEIYYFRIFYFIAIIMVVARHSSLNHITSFFGWFDSTTFMLCLFTFSSGYFFTRNKSKNIFKIIIKKIKKLIIPLYLWNLVYGLIVLILKNIGIIKYGADLSIETLLLNPLYSSHAFYFNKACWYIVPLFTIEIFSLIFLPVLKNKWGSYFIFILYLLLGMIGVQMFIKGYNTHWWLIISRFLYFLPFFALGILYNEKLEKHDTLKNTIYFSAVLFLELCLIYFNGGFEDYIPAWGLNFDNVICPYLFGILGIMFWLRISKVLVPVLKNNKIVNLISKNTFAIMVHHLFGFFILNLLWYFCSSNFHFIEKFNVEIFKTDIMYQYLPKSLEQFKFIYLIFGIGIPIVIAYALNNIKRIIFNQKKEVENKMTRKSSNIFNKKIETMKRRKLTRLQLKRLRKMVDYCIKNNQFYKDKLNKAGIKSGRQIKKISDISKIPFTTKVEAQHDYPKGMLCVPMSMVKRVHSSSGTKGKPTVGYYTKKDLRTWAEACARVLCLNGLTKDDIMQVSVGYGLFTGGFGFHQGAELVGSTIIPASTGNTQKQLVMLKDIGATALMATPSYATYLSEVIKDDKDKKSFKIKKVLLGAERCTKSMKDLIKKNLGCEPMDNYGLTECFGPGVAGECECHNGMHISEDIFYPEIINSETGEVLKDGEEGELVLTSLRREAMPLLRYRTGDITSITHEKCACGRTSVRMQSPFGRVDDMFVFKGVNIFPTQIEYALEGIKGISPYYLIRLERKNLKDIATLIIELPKNKDKYKEQELEKITKKIKTKLEEIIIVKISIKLVDPNTLERFTGKSKRVEDLRYKSEKK